ncbi:hypothetical protein SRHO_G00148760 [Serrasalmus rhombeus]
MVRVAKKNSLKAGGSNLERNQDSKGEPILLWSTPDSKRPLSLLVPKALGHQRPRALVPLAPMESHWPD